MADMILEPPRTPPPGKSQPIDMVAAQGPELDDAAVRQAIVTAEANNQDPMSVTLDDIGHMKVDNPQAKPVEVPEKFLKEDGVVDVEKIQASTQALDAAIQKKEEAIKSVDDYMREYNERQSKFSSLPNAEKTLSQIPAPPPPMIPTPQADIPNYEEIVRRDYEADPLGTTTRLLNLMIQQKFQPLEEKEKAERTRTNIAALAEKDHRVLREDVFAKVNEKLRNDPHFWNLKNPHRAAWLEVKDEMRLGELPQGAQAQPSRPLSPVLGGGTPPSAPSTSVPSPQNVLSNLDQLDLRKKDQEALGDEAIRRALMGHR